MRRLFLSKKLHHAEKLGDAPAVPHFESLEARVLMSAAGVDMRPLTHPGQVSPMAGVIAEAVSGNGLKGEYFDNKDFTNLKLTRTDATVNFNWGSAAPTTGMGVDTFSVRWTGQVQAQFSETYTFFTSSDDGVRLWVNGQLLVNNWTDHATKENQGSITLQAGQKYNIKLEYYENGGAAVSKLMWSSAHTAKQVIAQSQLYAATPATAPAPAPKPTPPTPAPTTVPPPPPPPVTVTPSTYNTTYGYGLIDAASAVAAAVGQPTFTDVPNITGPANAGDLNLIHAPEAWAHGFTGKGVIVAVIDTGVDYTHPDLDANIWTNTKEIAGNGIDDDHNGFTDDIHGYDFVNHDGDPMDDHGHGTHVSGTIAAENNGVGTTGIAFDAQIMAVKVLSASGSGFLSDVAAGIRYAVDNGANVINLSLGGPTGTSTLLNALKYASDHGVVVAMAAGNDGAAEPGYPAQYASSYGIAVGAVDRSGKIASFSNDAGAVLKDYVEAPGVAVTSTTKGGGYAAWSGTSMATPHVAALAALIKSANPSLTAPQIESIITGTANDDVVIV